MKVSLGLVPEFPAADAFPAHADVADPKNTRMVPSCPMFRHKLLISVLVLGWSASPGQAMNLRLEASTTWAENLNRSTAVSDWRDALKYEANTSLSLLREWHTGFITTGELDAGFTRVPRFSMLDTFTAGASGQARQKFGFGAYAPVLAVNAGLHALRARLDGDDGWTATAGLQLSKRLTPSWRVTAAGDWQQHYARSPIFDTKHHRAFGTVTWYFNDRWSLTHGNGRLWGSFTANASPGVWSRALAGAFGSRVSNYYHDIYSGVTDTVGPGWVTYLVDGRVNFWWLELSRALGRNTSLPLRYESVFSENKIGTHYRQDLWSLQVLHRF